MRGKKRDSFLWGWDEKTCFFNSPLFAEVNDIKISLIPDTCPHIIEKDFLNPFPSFFASNVNDVYDCTKMAKQ